MRVADRIREANKVISELVDCPEWGVKIEVRDTDLEQRDVISEASAMMMEEDDNGKRVMVKGALTDFHVALLEATCFDPDTGAQVFTTDEDRALIRTLESAPALRLVETATRLLGLGAEAVDEGKDDSSSTPSDATGSS